MATEFTEKDIENNRKCFSDWVKTTGNAEPYDPDSWHGRKVNNTKVL